MTNPKLDICNCCEGEIDFLDIYNRPGLPALSYRLGTHASFLRWMVFRLSTQEIPDGVNRGSRPLTELTTRSSDDPAIALLDAWATVADVLTFYQERIANEGFLRTATERFSVLELARAIGYELSPGVAASTVLAFNVEDALGTPGYATIPKGTKVQSLPAQDKLPQTFENSEEIAAKAEWNALRPRMSQPQQVIETVELLYFQGVVNNLQAGDLLLLVKDGMTTPKLVEKVAVESQGDWTRVEFTTNPQIPEFQIPNFQPGDFAEVSLDAIAFTPQEIKTHIIQKTWRDSDLNAFLALNKWNAKELLKQVATLKTTTTTQSNIQVFAFRTQVSCFGHNAPLWDTLPKLDNILRPGATDPYKNSWDQNNGRTIWTNSQGVDYSSSSNARVYLEREVPEVVNEGWVVFATLDANPLRAAYKIQAVGEASLADYGISGKTTSLDLQLTSKPDQFRVRKTTAYVQSESLPLLLDSLSWLQNPPIKAASFPIEDAIEQGDKQLILEQMTLGLRIGQLLVLTGEESRLNSANTDNSTGTIRSEILQIQNIIHHKGYTILYFDKGLNYNYIRTTVTLNANAVRATHGETGREILGGGNGAAKNQHFTLRKPPLTYVSSSQANGTESTLEVRVDNVLWQEVSSLYSLDSRSQSYIVRLDNENKPTVIFGDGINGARLPSGMENVVATYRTGIGLDGQVEAGSLTLLQTRPYGVRDVTNPVPAIGAAAPETLDNARTNAPMKVRTLERIVSLTDFEDFARSFAGIGKAQAVALWNGDIRLVHLTIAGDKGDEITANSQLYNNLVQAINFARDPVHPIQVDSYKPLYFKVKINVLVDQPRYLKTDVFAQVETALKTAFSFANRAFGQTVTAAEVLTVIQKVSGVIAADLDELYLPPNTGGLNSVLAADIAHWDDTTKTIELAELLLVNPVGISLSEMP
ncbi:putative baseplate assembly protein [Nostoc minutum NIES-26]|uniref:Baseplate assembly protein n=1 Tax=Nostoc minutum NIES-26 TaxID=1844469 RepID=A0A367QZ06_9NOSO|nr:putative baseplate assembly protein [Nostoc minutum NIES-26]